MTEPYTLARFMPALHFGNTAGVRKLVGKQRGERPDAAGG